MTNKRMTLHQHHQTGHALKSANEMLHSKLGYLPMSHYPKQSAVVAKCERLLEAISKLRSELDDQLFSEYPDKETDKLTRIYYGPRNG